MRTSIDVSGDSSETARPRRQKESANTKAPKAGPEIDGDNRTVHVTCAVQLFLTKQGGRKLRATRSRLTRFGVFRICLDSLFSFRSRVTLSHNCVDLVFFWLCSSTHFVTVYFACPAVAIYATPVVTYCEVKTITTKSADCC